MSVTVQEAIHKISLHLYRSTDLYNRALSKEYREAAAEFKRMMDAEQMAIEALREKAEREDPQPLTFEELLQMDGEPVWLHTITDPRPYRCGLIFVQVAEIRTAMYCAFWAFGNECEIDRSPDEYGKTWIAYRHKPKEVQK